MKPVHFILMLTMNAAWAGTYSAYKIIGPDLSSSGIVTVRFGLAAIALLLAWPWLGGSAPRGGDLIKACLMGLVLFVLGQRLQVYGNELGTASNSAVLMGVEPLITSLGAALFLHECIGRRRMAGFALGMVGVALTSGVGRKDFQWMGLGASLVFVSSFICEAAYSVIGKPLLCRASPMKLLTVSLLAGLAGNLIIDGPATVAAACLLPAKAWVLLVLLALICTALGYGVWLMVIRESQVNVVALTVFSQSIFGVPIAVLWLHETFHTGQWLGCLVILAGLLIGLSRQIGSSAQNKKACADPAQE